MEDSLATRRKSHVVLRAAKRLDQRLHRLFSGRSSPLVNPLCGDRSIEFAFVIEQLAGIDRSKSVLDVGCCGSPLTTAIKAMGFQNVHGIDLMPTPVEFPGIKFFAGDFLTARDLNAHYDIVVFCSSIEHFGLGGRYGSQDSSGYDLQALQKAIDMLPPGGMLVLTVPYGVERTIAPWHRVYNKESELLKHALANLEVKKESFFARTVRGPWAPCTEAEAARVIPTEDSYALGMFRFTRPE
jgi:2-polyprenyl-3-methyl-5-hydroxy-6-metoxy-1,4-benzoquinol methylase